MPRRQASQTALATAYLRAAHQVLDSKPLILEDPVAVPLLGAGTEQRIRDAADRYRTPEALALRSHVVLRSRYAEDRLAAAVGRGVTQYVLVGAGFDTFALRQPEWADSLKVIEIDHPDSQAAKRARIAAAGMQLPANALLAEIDFERESLFDGLRRNGVTTAEPTLFSWLGVTMYLTEAAIDATLASMAAFPEGSEVVLTFLSPPASDARASPSARSRIAQRVAEAGEPFLSRFEPAAFERKLLAAGFSSVDFLTPAMADSSYFQQRPKDLPPPHRTGIAAARR
jgi:methyltransferase (TIGR00027 family)